MLFALDIESQVSFGETAWTEVQTSTSEGELSSKHTLKWSLHAKTRQRMFRREPSHDDATDCFDATIESDETINAGSDAKWTNAIPPIVDGTNS
jgi:hypothetical protein